MHNVSVVALRTEEGKEGRQYDAINVAGLLLSPCVANRHMVIDYWTDRSAAKATSFLKVSFSPNEHLMARCDAFISAIWHCEMRRDMATAFGRKATKKRR